MPTLKDRTTVPLVPDYFVAVRLAVLQTDQRRR